MLNRCVPAIGLRTSEMSFDGQSANFLYALELLILRQYVKPQSVARLLELPEALQVSRNVKESRSSWREVTRKDYIFLVDNPKIPPLSATDSTRGSCERGGLVSASFP